MSTIAIGIEEMNKCASTAEACGWNIDGAMNHVLAQLTSGPKSAEKLTLSCIIAGFKPHDKRAFGAVYCRLLKAGKIMKDGTCIREFGHGTTGGNIWRLA